MPRLRAGLRNIVPPFRQIFGRDSKSRCAGGVDASTTLCFAGTARTLLTMASEPVANATKAPTRRQQQQEVDATAKDDTELRLEKALFGDTAGFLDSLSAARYGEGKALKLYSSESDDNAASNDEDLSDVPDENVSIASRMPPLFLTFSSFSSWMQALDHCPPLSPMRMAKMRHQSPQIVPEQFGMTATTTG